MTLLTNFLFKFKLTDILNNVMMKKHAPHPEFDVPMLAEDGECRYLHFDSPWAQGAMSLSKPNSLVFEYTKQMCAWLLFQEVTNNKAMALLGLGAGSHFRFLQHYTQATISCVEWSELVIMCAQDHFHVEETERCQIVQSNAETWVHDVDVQGQYDVLMVDLYDYTAEGPVCSSKKFYKGCANVLGKSGIATFNLFGHHPSFAKNLTNIRAAFDNRVIMFPETEDGNRIVIAFKGPVLERSVGELKARAKQVEADYALPAPKFLEVLLKEQANQHIVQMDKVII